ncbi:MAG: vWA domain-containing protein [Planctomycetota bacterium]
MFLLLFLAVPAPGQATVREGLDLVVVVDQSGSMVGTGSAPKNDPLNIRNHMVTFALDLLANSSRHNHVRHRLGVVSFGSTVRLDLALAQGEVDPSGIDLLRVQVEEISTRPSLGQTDFLAAIEAAAAQFASIPQDPRRDRAIILITDGAPSVPNMELAKYNRELLEYAQAHFPKAEYRIEVVALNDPSSDYWSRYQKLWNVISNGHARKLTGDEREMYRVLHQIVTELAGVPVVPPVEGELILPPFLETVVFDIFTVGRDADVLVFPPNQPDQPLQDDSGDVEISRVGDILVSYTVHRPKAGIWRFQEINPEDGVEILSQQFFPRGRLLEPATEQSVRQFDRAHLAYQVVDGEERPVKPEPGYPLRLELELIAPDGSRRTQTLQSQGNDEAASVFRTVEPLDLLQAGRYQVEILVATKDLRGNPVNIYQDRWSSFEVTPAKKIACVLSEPRAGTRVPLWGPLLFQPQKVPIEIVCGDEDARWNLEALIGGDPRRLFQMQLQRGKEPLVPATLELETGEGTSVFTGELGGASSFASYTLVPATAPGVLPQDYNLRFEPREVEFSRTYTAVHVLQALVLVLVVAIGLILATRRLYLNLRAPLRGTLHIEQAETHREIGSLTLTGRSNRRRFKEEQLPVQTGITSLVVRAVPGAVPSLVLTAEGRGGESYLDAHPLRARQTVLLRNIPYRITYDA